MNQRPLRPQRTGVVSFGFSDGLPLMSPQICIKFQHSNIISSRNSFLFEVIRYFEEVNRGMSPRWKQMLLIGLMAVLLFLIAWQSIHIWRGIAQVHRPTPQSRQDGKMGVHHWNTVAEVARNLGITVDEVFTYLKIVAEPGDENLTFRALKDKYHKTSEEMQSNLDRLITDHKGKSGKPHE